MTTQQQNAAADIARALPKCRKRGPGYMACCPAHQDTEPSLSITEREGKILVHCHAGCTQDSVIDALRALGLWSDREHRSHRDVDAIYNYTDELGNLLYQVVRKTGKKFLQRCPDGRGGWIWRKNERQSLYRLPEVLEAPIVFVVEGERDVETLRSHGFVATTNAGGAKAPWLPGFTEALRGREVILIPDNDEPGRLRVLAIARALFGVTANILILELEGAKDVTEWFENGHSEVELISQIEGVSSAR